MYKIYIHYSPMIRYTCLCFTVWSICTYGITAQDTLPTYPEVKSTPVTNTFEGNWIIDNQTVMVAPVKTFEFDIQHRFGLVTNGFSDFYGIFAPANIRLGVSYVPLTNLVLGYGYCKERLQMDGSLKYAIITQSEVGGWPVSISYLGDMAIEVRDKENYVNFSDRISYFNQLMIARKVTNKFSAQVAPSLTYFNNVEGYYNSEGGISPKKNNSHYAIAFMGRYKLTEVFGLIANYDQPITQHPTDNPHPNVSFGMEIGTRSHIFQFFATNYQSILPQSNNFYNQNDYTEGEWLIGFNITKKWHY